MSPALTRRGFAKAGAAALGASAMGITIAAQATTTTSAPRDGDLDAELFRLIDRWRDVEAETRAIEDALDAAMDRARAACPPRPAELYSGFGDTRFALGAIPTGRVQGPDGACRACFAPGDVEKLRVAPPLWRWAVAESDTEKPRREPDHEGEARRQEIVAAHDRWVARCEAVNDAVGYTASTEVWMASLNALNAAECAVKLCPARTLPGLARKAAWIADMLARSASDDDLAEVFARQVAAFGGQIP